jgi:hypothetical protein
LPADAKKRLKGSRWWWVTNPENLRVEDREALAQLRQEFPRLGQLWEQRERLRAIFDNVSIQTTERGRER